MGPRRDLPHSCGAVLDAQRGVSMIASTSHPGSQVFLRRARHFARRELYEQHGGLPVSHRMLSYFLLHLAGVTAADIAAWESERREHMLRRIVRHEDVTPEDASEWAVVTQQSVAKQLMACIAIIGRGETRARIRRLAEEMGRINFEPREAVLLRFPGPPRLAAPQTREAVV